MGSVKVESVLQSPLLTTFLTLLPSPRSSTIRTVFHSKSGFLGGFTPRFGADTSDIGVLLGLKGDTLYLGMGSECVLWKK